MKTRVIPIVLVVAWLLAISSAPADAQGTVLARHAGSSDPASEGFTMETSGSLLKEAGAVSGDAGLDAWYTRVGAGSTLWYRQPLESATLVGNNWSLSLTLRVVQSSSSFGNSFALVAAGEYRFMLRFGLEADGDPFVALGTSSLSPVVVLDGAGPGYHDYELRYSAALGTAEFWADGVKRFDNVSSAGQSVGATFLWGEGQAGPSQANWHRVSLQIIPEPSFLALLGLGGGWLVWRRVKRRQSG